MISFRLLQGLFGSRARIFDHLEPNLGNREFYSITCSALANTLTGIVMPREFAVFKLITSSNFVDCSTGTSAGFAPRRLLRHVDTWSRNSRRRSKGHPLPRILEMRSWSATCLKGLIKGRGARVCRRQYSDSRHLGFLRARGERPPCCRPDYQRDELAPLHVPPRPCV